jgi:hypothetical protein
MKWYNIINILPISEADLHLDIVVVMKSFPHKTELGGIKYNISVSIRRQCIWIKVQYDTTGRWKQ